MNFGRLGSRQISLLRVKKIGLWGVMLLVVAGGFWKEWESATRASVDRREIPSRTRDEQREIKIEKKSLKRQSTPVLKIRDPQIEEPLTGQRSANHSPLSSQLRQGPWTLPLQRLVEVGRSGEEVTDALTDLLECQSGMGDTLLQLLLEGGGTRDEKRALLVALGTALVLSPSPEGLWVDRRSCLEWAIELWIDGYEDLSSLDRWLWQVEGIDGSRIFMDRSISDRSSSLSRRFFKTRTVA